MRHEPQGKLLGYADNEAGNKFVGKWVFGELFAAPMRMKAMSFRDLPIAAVINLNAHWRQWPIFAPSLTIEIAATNQSIPNSVHSG